MNKFISRNDNISSVVGLCVGHFRTQEVANLWILVGWCCEYYVFIKSVIYGNNDIQIYWWIHVSRKRTWIMNYSTINILCFFFFVRINGPFAVLMSYLSEFHGLKYRSRVMMSTGMFFSFANITLPLLAWFIIPKQHWNITFIEGYFGESFEDFL